jgi:hypothetical protein
MTTLPGRVPAAVGQSASPPRPDHGVAGNARLTGMTAVVLFVLLAAEGVTILGIRRLLPEHVFFGFLLIPPVLLKLASTGYRFMRYYTGNRRYRAAGPPRLLARLIAPVVVLSTGAVFVTGIELWLFGRQFGALWLAAHKLSFLLWFGATGIHVLTYLGRVPGLAFADVRHEAAVAGASSRRYLVGAAVLLGVVLAIAASRWATPFVLFGGD